MNRKNLIHGYGTNLVLVSAIYTGGGAAADLTVPAHSTFTRECNAASTGTIGATGVYTCVLAENSVPPRVFQVIPHVEGGSTQAFVTTEYVAATRTVVVSTFTEAGVAADLATTENLKLLIIGQDSTA